MRCSFSRIDMSVRLTYSGRPGSLCCDLSESPAPVRIRGFLARVETGILLQSVPACKQCCLRCLVAGHVQQSFDEERKKSTEQSSVTQCAAVITGPAAARTTCDCNCDREQM
jgi:hypothetical protein